MRKRWKQRLLAGALGAGSTYTQKVQALGPIAYWPLAESGGSTANDESGNGRNGAYTSVTLGAVGIGDGRTATLFIPASNSFMAPPAAARTAFNGSEGSAILWIKMGTAGVWTDGQTRTFVCFLVDTNNFMLIRKTPTNNTLNLRYSAGGTGLTVTTTSSSTDWLHLALTWSKSGDQVKGYVNGAQVDTTKTGLGVWAGTPAAADTVVGARNTTPSEVHSGTLAHAALFARVLSAAEIASLAIP